MAVERLDQASAEVDYVERARALAPLIEAHADEIERERRISEPVLAGLFDAGLFRLLVPRSIGGGEVRPSVFVQTIEAIAKADGSTAWCLSQAVGSAIAAGFLKHHVADELFGPPRTVLASGHGKAEAVAVDGGYRINVDSSFASGIRHASLLGAHCTIVERDGVTPRLNADGKPEMRTMLFAPEEAEVIDIWQVIGLRGTASDRYRVGDLFVPEERTFLYSDPEPVDSGTLYLFSTRGMHAMGFAALGLGIARSMLDAITALAVEKTPRGKTNPLREEVLFQAMAGESNVRLEAARNHLIHTLDDVWENAARTHRMSLDDRVRIRAASSYAMLEAREVATKAYHAAGATAVFLGSAFERRFRDLHTAAQQVQGRIDHYVTVGRHLLGLEPSRLHL